MIIFVLAPLHNSTLSIISDYKRSTEEGQDINLIKIFDSCSETTQAASAGLPGLTRGEQMAGI
jgi:hypothetical protein